MSVKSFLLNALYKCGGLAPFRFSVRDQVLILTYHRFGGRPSPTKISKDEFHLHLDYLKRNCNVVSLSEAVAGIYREQPLPQNAVAITIDDGYRDAYEIAFPLLKQRELPATLFAVTGFLDGNCWIWTDLMRYILATTKHRALNVTLADGEVLEAKVDKSDQRTELAGLINSSLKKMPNGQKDSKILEIAKLMEVEIPEVPTEEFAPIRWHEALEMDRRGLRIESHTVTHPILTNISLRELEHELRASMKRLNEVLGREIEHFCYPNGDHDSTVQRAVEDAGYSSAVTTRYGFNRKKANRFLLRRADASPRIDSFAQTASGLEALRLRMRQFIA